jgi:hypothetical protein
VNTGIFDEMHLRYSILEIMDTCIRHSTSLVGSAHIYEAFPGHGTKKVSPHQEEKEDVSRHPTLIEMNMK